MVLRQMLAGLPLPQKWGDSTDGSTDEAMDTPQPLVSVASSHLRTQVHWGISCSAAPVLCEHAYSGIKVIDIQW